MYNDEIVSIEEYKEVETIDISVSGNHLFYANGILTHNSSFDAQYLSMSDVSDSIGIVQSADTIIGIVPGGEDAPDKEFLSVLKSRQTDKAKLKPTAVNVSTEHQRVWDIDDKRSARVPIAVTNTMTNMANIVDEVETLTLNPNSDLSSMFSTPPT